MTKKYVNFALVCLAAIAVVVFYQNCAGEHNITGQLSGENIEASTAPSLIVAFGDSLTRGGNPKAAGNTGIKGYVPYLKQKFPASDILNCGIGGQTTEDAWLRYTEIINGDYRNCTLDTVDSSTTAAFYNYSSFQGRKPDLILLWLGTNDVLKNQPNQRASAGNFENYFHFAHQGGIRIITSTIPPYGNTTTFHPMIVAEPEGSYDRVQTMNAVIEQAAVRYNVTVVDAHAALKQNFQQYTWDQIHLTADAYQILTPLWENAIKNNVGKPRFIVSGQASCSTASGVQIPSGVAVCSCASNETGQISRCNNGQYSFMKNLNVGCKSLVHSDHKYIVHHCPMDRSTGGTPPLRTN